MSTQTKRKLKEEFSQSQPTTPKRRKEDCDSVSETWKLFEPNVRIIKIIHNKSKKDSVLRSENIAKDASVASETVKSINSAKVKIAKYDTQSNFDPVSHSTLIKANDTVNKAVYKNSNNFKDIKLDIKSMQADTNFKNSFMRQLDLKTLNDDCAKQDTIHLEAEKEEEVNSSKDTKERISEIESPLNK